jgi:branched-chain amino acid transport system ATP-binding protein
VLTVDDLHCAYLTARVLNGVNISVADGEVVALLGRNGMGKTSLVRCLFNLQPPQVSAGTITYDGQALSRLTSHAIARQGLGLVPQGRRIFTSLTVEENLTSTARTPDGRDAWDLAKVYAFFPRLAERRTNRGGNLSGGEQQMLAIGRALMGNPTLLVMDEASEGLAPAVLRDIRDRLRLLKDEGMSVFFVEQNIGMALSLADRVYVLGSSGTIVWSGTTAEFDLQDVSLRSHLGV